MPVRSLTLCSLVFLLAGGASAARQPGDPIRPGFNLFSKQDDIQLGKEAAQEVRKKYPEVKNAFLQSYVRQVGERLAATPPARNSGFPFRFTVLKSPEVNAFALPGGPMFIFTGLLKSVDNEAQLAAVMAHEMSHVILRHGTHEASKAEFIRIPALLAGVVAGKGSMLAGLANMGANGFILKFSRDAESEADALGARMMADAGYDPVEMARFFHNLRASGGQGDSALAQFLSDHPNPGNRERAIEEEAATMPRRRYGYDTGQFARMKAAVASMPGPKR